MEPTEDKSIPPIPAEGTSIPPIPSGGTSTPPEIKQRHGCLTAWLIFMIIANSLTALLYLFASDLVTANLPSSPPNLLIMLMGVVGLANVLFAVLLLQWKKIGFYGFLFSSIAALIINISIGLGIAQSLIGLAGIAILYGILQIKQSNVTGWDQLE